MSDPSNSLFVSELARIHGDKLRRFLRGRVRNDADVSDVLQEVFLRMLRIPDYEIIRSPEAYLFRVALHVAQQHAMREQGAPSSVNIAELMSELQASADADPALIASADQCLESFMRALDSLSPHVRATFILHRQHGLTLEEISRELGISFPMAKKHLVRALMECKQHLLSDL